MEKKKIILATCFATAMAFSAVNVNAALVPSEKNCKDGKVYTNYYYFSDANVKDPTTGYLKDDYTTQGNYTAKIIQNSGITLDKFIATLEQKAGQDENLLIQRGEMEVVGDSQDASAIDKIGLTDFWTKMKAGDTVSGNETHNVYHTWYRIVNSKREAEQTHSLSFESLTVDQVKSASVKTNTKTAVSYATHDGSGSETRLTFQVYRPYSSGVTPYIGSGETFPYTVNGNSYNWYVTPAAYYIQYCMKADDVVDPDPTPTDPTKKTLTLSYDGNGTNVTNVPNSQSFDEGKSTNVTKDQPTRKDFTFQGWNSQADGKGTNYDAGTAVNKTMTLYAQWKSNSKPADNPKTGVSTNVILFSGIALAGIAGLVIARKKGLFRQI